MRLILILIFIPSVSIAKLKVAVLDTGVDTEITNAPLCSKASPDSSNIKHGTSIVDLIAKNAGKADYCIESYRIYTNKWDKKAYFNVLRYLLKNPPDIINLSIQGTGESPTETKLIKQLLNKGVTILVAAGNYGEVLSKKSCNVYPACADNRIIVVGTYSPSSDKGDRINILTHKDSGCVGAYCLSGTSQATAIETGRFIHFLSTKENAK